MSHREEVLGWIQGMLDKLHFSARPDPDLNQGCGWLTGSFAGWLVDTFSFEWFLSFDFYWMCLLNKQMSNGGQLIRVIASALFSTKMPTKPNFKKRLSGSNFINVTSDQICRNGKPLETMSVCIL